MLLTSCTKDPLVTKSQWTINGETHLADSTFLVTDNPLYEHFIESNGKGYFVHIFFNSFPTQNQVYNVIYGHVSSNTDCTIDVGNITGIYSCIDTTNEILNVTLVAGKIHASFNRIAVKNIYPPYDTAYVTGTIIQNY